MQIVFFHRKKVKGNFSIENLFEIIRLHLPQGAQSKVKRATFQSKGFIRRLYIILECFFSKGEINHITGDIHFIALVLPKARTVLTIHDLGFMNRPDGFAKFVLKWFWIKFPVLRSAVVTTVSEETKKEVLKYCSVSASKIKVIYNPISSAFVKNHKEFNRNQPIILQIGTKPNKNIPILAAALSALPCQLRIIGNLDYETRNILSFYGINYAVFEDLTGQEVVEQYNSCDIVTFISLIEGFGLPIVEANAVGRVVITSNISSMPEIARDAAHLVNPTDVDSIRAGFIKIINDDAYRQKLISNGFENEKRFQVSTIAAQYFDVYKSLGATNHFSEK